MINWIVGGVIIGFTLYFIIRFIKKARKGESICCSDCNKGICSCKKNNE